MWTHLKEYAPKSLSSKSTQIERRIRSWQWHFMRTGHVKTAANRAHIFRCRSYGRFNKSEKRSHETRPRIKTIGQFCHKTLGFVGNTVRLRALITPFDTKRVGFCKVFVAWVTSTCSKMHTTIPSVSDLEACVCCCCCCWQSAGCWFPWACSDLSTFAMSTKSNFSTRP